MLLLRRIGFYVFIAASIVAAVWAYFRLKESKAPRTSVLEHIPANAMCVIETKNCSELVSQLTRQNLIWNSLLSNTSIQVAQNGIRFLDSLINSSSEIADIVSDNSVYWSFIKKEKTTEHLILFKVKETNNEALLEDFFTKVFAKDASVSSFEAFYFTNNKQKWLVCCKGGIVYVASDIALIQDCLELKKEESLANNKLYTDLLKENGEQKNQIYFNHLLTPLLSKRLFTEQSLFGMDVQLDEITLTGYSNPDSASLLGDLKHQNPSGIEGFESLPDNPDIIQGVTLSDVNLFYKSVNGQQSKDTRELNANAWQQLNDSALYNIQSETFENIDKEILSATYVLDNVTGGILSLKVKDEEKAITLLTLMSDSIVSSADIKTFRINKAFSQLFSFTESDFKNEYGCVNDGHVLFFSNKAVLDYYLQAVANSQLLGKNTSFMAYANDNLSLECNFLYYENVELLKAHNLNSVITSEVFWMTENVASRISLTAKNFKNNMQVRINATHAQTKATANTSSSLWAYTADSTITSGAHIFVNHLTQENELCFQDYSNQLYLINATGNLLWKKKIDETIQSSIYTVDIFKNGKFQMLFNTKNYLHLIDRNGNYVQGFPVKLPARVTSDITLLDYEGNKDYRILLACADKRIYNFNLYGVKTEGFTPVKTDDEVTLPISYVRVGASDYLITVDVSGKIYAFSRKGEGRIDFKNRTIEHLKDLYVLPGNNLDNTKLIYLDDKNNLLNKVSLTDKKEALKIGDELNDFKTSFVLINDDSQKDMLVYGNGAFYAYDLFTGKLLEYFNEQAVYDDVQLVQTSNNEWFLAFDKAGQKTDVITMAGKLAMSLPNSSYKPLVSDLYKNGKTYILQIGGNKITCQELK